MEKLHKVNYIEDFFIESETLEGFYKRYQTNDGILWFNSDNKRITNLDALLIINNLYKAFDKKRIESIRKLDNPELGELINRIETKDKKPVTIIDWWLTKIYLLFKH